MRWLVAPVLWLFILAAYAENALVEGLHLKPASAAVKVGGTVKLNLDYCIVKSGSPSAKQIDKSNDKPGGKNNGATIADDELAPLVQPKPDDDLAPLPALVCEGDEGYKDALVPVDAQWKVVDGPGRVSGDNKGATYHAPASKSKPNQATLAVTFKYPLSDSGKNYPKAKQTLLSRIAILDEVKTYGGTFTVNDVTVNSK